MFSYIHVRRFSNQSTSNTQDKPSLDYSQI
uniref:Uncharacterized protein n=1 Tax=Rhizophora mucronata TaxID=61149 RepID=A0A2P2N141_RHIMU